MPHIYLILEIALLHEKDIDHPDRVAELAAVIAAAAAAAEARRDPMTAASPA